MKMPISEIEQRIYEEKIHLLNDLDLEKWAYESFSDKQFRLVFIKAVNNLIRTYNEEFIQFERNNVTDASLLDDNELAKNVLEQILLKLVRVAAVEPKKGRVLKVRAPKVRALKDNEIKTKEFKGYTTGDVATFFGVSTTTVNNWINEGRFLREFEDGRVTPIERKAVNAKIKIHPDIWYDAPSGVRYQIKELIEAYEVDKKEWEESKKFNTVEESRQISLYLEHFRNKYNGDFNSIFGEKNWDEMTPEQETDAAMWSFFLQRVNDEKDPENS